MMRCIHCQTTLLPNARFCHSCGEKVQGKAVTCPSCQTLNAPGAQFCTVCSCALAVVPQTQMSFGSASYVSKYDINFDASYTELTEQIQKYFAAALEQRIQADYDPKLHKEYRAATKVSPLIKNNIPLLAKQWADNVYTIHCRQDETVSIAIDQYLNKEFDIQMDIFFFDEAATVSEFSLNSEKIQKYAYAKRNEIDVEQMIFDYLEVTKETKEKIYLDLLTVPENKIRNAAKSFLFADGKEKIFMLCDQTVFGSCKEGFAITERGIYWKAHFNKAAAVSYENLQDIQRENGWITINNRYFHINKIFDFKLMKLLQKLKQVF